MPFFDPLKLLTRNDVPVIEAYVYFKKNIFIQLVRLVVIELLILIFILVPQRRNITQHCRSRGKTSSAFAIKELLISKSTFNYESIVFIFHKGQVIIMFYKLR